MAIPLRSRLLGSPRGFKTRSHGACRSVSMESGSKNLEEYPEFWYEHIPSQLRRMQMFLSQVFSLGWMTNNVTTQHADRPLHLPRLGRKLAETVPVVCGRHTVVTDQCSLAPCQATEPSPPSPLSMHVSMLGQALRFLPVLLWLLALLSTSFISNMTEGSPTNRVIKMCRDTYGNLITYQYGILCSFVFLCQHVPSHDSFSLLIPSESLAHVTRWLFFSSNDVGWVGCQHLVLTSCRASDLVLPGLFQARFP